MLSCLLGESPLFFGETDLDSRRLDLDVKWSLERERLSDFDRDRLTADRDRLERLDRERDFERERERDFDVDLKGLLRWFDLDREREPLAAENKNKQTKLLSVMEYDSCKTTYKNVNKWIFNFNKLTNLLKKKK